MKKIQHSRFFPVLGLLLGSLVWLANNGNPPTGKTAAPFNGNCNDCHTGGNFNGNVEITGFPTNANPNETYDITIKTTATVGSPSRAGFQLVVVDANNNNCGDLISIAGNGTGTELLQTREYMEQRTGRNFAGGIVSWEFQWKAPNSVPGDQVKVYYIVNLCNGNGGTGGDNPIWDNLTFGFSGPTPVTASISETINPLCNGDNNGSATVQADGGTPPYTYLWTGGQTTQTATNLSAGVYVVTVTASANSGTATAVATLTEPPLLQLSTQVSGPITCIASATATASASGGTPGYSFLWSDGQTGETAIFGLPGTYTVTVTDANGCSRATSVLIQGDVAPPVAVALGGTLTCIVSSIQLNGTGSSAGPNFGYLWMASNGGNIVSGATTLTPLVNACGTYTLTVTNNTNGCTASATTNVVCDATPPNVTVLGGTLTCTSQMVMLQGSSSVPNAVYLWSGPGIDAANQGLQNPIVGVVGVYTLTVTSPVNGCTNTATTTVTENTTQPGAIGTVSGILTCTNDTVVLALITMIQNPLFAWEGPNGFLETTQQVNVSLPGTYIGIVINSQTGCRSSDTLNVLQSILPPGASAGVSGQINCLTDTVQLTGNSPASPDVTYVWTGLNFMSNSQNPLVDTAGLYTLVVSSNFNGCTSSAAVTVVRNTTPPIDSIVPPINLNCNNPTIQLNASPSSQGPNFVYVWTAKEGGSIVSGDSTLTPVVDSTGKYFLQITNLNNGCSTLDSVVVKASVPVTISLVSSENGSCFGSGNGSASVLADGGDGVYSYQWSTGDTISTVQNLMAGVYAATVTDGENCSASTILTITEPDVLLANISATGESALGANDGTASANPSGGTAPYSFLWSNGGDTETITDLAPGHYSVSITDELGCQTTSIVTVNAFGCNLQVSAVATDISCSGLTDGTAQVTLTGAVDPVDFTWSNGDSTQIISDLTAGTYTVTVQDGNACSALANVKVNDATAIFANATATNETAVGAQDGAATALPVGGSSPYSYLWSNGGTEQSIVGLSPGTYTVTVTDAKQCSTEQTVSVATVNCAIQLSISATDAQCFGNPSGFVSAVVSGGALPYAFIWSNGPTGQTQFSVPAGTYTVTATDAAGCVAVQSVVVNQPDQLVATVASVQNVLCPTDLTGSVTITVTGGNGPYSYNWPNGSGNNLGVGNYTVTITDSGSCSTLVGFSIVANDSIPPTITCPADIQICGVNFVNYSPAIATDNCGMMGLPILVSGPISGSVFDEGTFTVVYQATDLLGNTATCAFTITIFGSSDILIDDIVPDMNNQQVGSISVTAVGFAPFTYAWNKNGQAFANTEDLSGLGVGFYTLTITDVNGCTAALSPIEIANTVGTTDLANTGSVRLWPNPTTATIQLEIIDLDILMGQIIDLRGGLIQTLRASELSEPIQVESLPSGPYILVLRSKAGKVLRLTFVKS